MPSPTSRAERRLASFCRLFGAVYLVGGAFFALAPGVTYRIASLGDVAAPGPEALFWNALAVAMMVAIGVACLVVARDPRTMRHALLPVIAAKLTSSVLGIVHLKAGRALPAICVTDFPLFVITLLLYRAAAPGVHIAQGPAERPAEQEQAAAPVQLGVPK